MAHGTAMGHLKKTVFCNNRADFYRFEKSIISGISQLSPAHLEFNNLLPLLCHYLKQKAASD